MFRFDGADWIEQAKITSSDIQDGDLLGWSVSLSGETAVIGAWRDGDAGPDTGSAYVIRGLSDCNNNGVLDLCDIVDGNSDDDNNNGILDECECPWDLDDDDVVGTTDLLLLLGAWGTDPDGPPDFNGDGNVGTSDLIELLGNWVSCKGARLCCPFARSGQRSWATPSSTPVCSGLQSHSYAVCADYTEWIVAFVLGAPMSDTAAALASSIWKMRARRCFQYLEEQRLSQAVSGVSAAAAL